MAGRTDMDWTKGAAPSLDDVAALAQAAYDALPAAFRARCGDVVVRVEDFAEDAVLEEMGIEDPFDLTGLYAGVDLTRQSHLDVAEAPNMVFLYRRPILDEWCARGDVALGHLVAHVLVHEIGHHFGLSDDEMDRIERGAE